MKAAFDNSTIKIWFSNQSVSRNINNVIEIDHVVNLMKITDNKGQVCLLNFDNINLIEEIKQN